MYKSDWRIYVEKGSHGVSKLECPPLLMLLESILNVSEEIL